MTTKGVEEIVGTQIVELVIRQSASVSSDWSAVPNVSIDWKGKIHKIGGVLTGTVF